MSAGRESSGQARRRIAHELRKLAEKQEVALSNRDGATFRELEAERVELRCELEGLGL